MLHLPRRSKKSGVTRRELLRAGFAGIGLFSVGGTLVGCGNESGARTPRRVSNLGNLGPLGEPDANGVRLPAGFTSRVLARSRQKALPNSDYIWHLAPDGGATYATTDGGWIYVSNSEVPVQGGVGAMRFDAAGNPIDAYRILNGTNINCAGGPTPWGTWLSCEEFPLGQVWECDPHGELPAVVRPALGSFQHEAVAVDSELWDLYLTEDRPDGRFYRFRPAGLIDGFPDLENGTLSVAQVLGGGETGEVVWHAVPNPMPASDDAGTRLQVAESTAFRGGEGIWFRNGIVYFSTKGDNRVWAYDTEGETLDILYDDNNYAEPQLTGVDNIVATDEGDVVVVEDGGNMEVVVITPAGQVVAIAQIVGQDSSEITGPAFSPNGEHLYFSSQRGTLGHPGGGITYEVTGPFFTLA